MDNATDADMALHDETDIQGEVNDAPRGATHVLTGQSEGLQDVDALEQSLLGRAPNDPFISGEATLLSRHNLRGARLAALRQLFTEQPALRIALQEEFEKAWRNSGEHGVSFVAATAERRAQIITAAELLAFQRNVSSTTATFRANLARYLTEHAGYSDREDIA